MSPSATLREIAALVDDVRIRTLVEQLAVELEHQHNQQNNAFQTALSLTELHLTERIDAIEALVRHAGAGR